MYEYTIQYQYDECKGIKIIRADDDEQAIAIMWKQLNNYMNLAMAYQKSKIIDVREVEN